MTMTDPVADFLTRLRNANTAHHDSMSVPYSKLKGTIAEILKTEKIAVIKASYFEHCLSKGVPFEDRASIPPEYIMKGWLP